MHSTGILFIDGTSPAAHPYADATHFYADDGDLHWSTGFNRPIAPDTLGGWLPDLTTIPNPPNGALTTCYVADGVNGSKGKLVNLIAAHRDRFGECRVWCWPAGTEMALWVRDGMPIDEADLELASEPGLNPEPGSDDGWSTDH